MINEVQKLQFELMKIATFNSFDGKEVVKDLEDNQDLWTGAIMKRNDLIPLRDIHDNYWNVDTLYILASDKDNSRLELLARSWSADEVDWLSQKDLEGHCEKCYSNNTSIGSYPADKYKVLRVWWD